MKLTMEIKHCGILA